MKQYPSITSSTGQTFREITDAYIFDKLDGSNLRFEWSRKRGWYKFGTRQRMFDETDDVFGPAIPIFNETLADQIEKIARDKRWDRLVVFAEYHGPSSFAGTHDPDDKMVLSLIDASVHKQGMMGPREYLDTFEGLPQAAFLGQRNWTRGFIDEVRQGLIDGITFEGVVGKSGSGRDHNLVMAKAKTEAWIKRVREKFSATDAENLINS